MIRKKKKKRNNSKLCVSIKKVLHLPFQAGFVRNRIYKRGKKAVLVLNSVNIFVWLYTFILMTVFCSCFSNTCLIPWCSSGWLLCSRITWHTWVGLSTKCLLMRSLPVAPARKSQFRHTRVRPLQWGLNSISSRHQIHICIELEFNLKQIQEIFKTKTLVVKHRHDTESGTVNHSVYAVDFLCLDKGIYALNKHNL